ncbi:ABC transporter substrate-binding protein [Halomontanus rarus]|uniref:ABC transporter substrate-binding protein n=1 Tax=Halomontanus rarus TaxID=3034020 RepID=UPI001A99F4B3
MSRDSTMKRRRFLQATGGAASAVALAGCIGGDGGDGNGDGNGENESGNGNGDENESGEDVDLGSGDNILNLVNSTMTTLDPIASTDTASGSVIQQMYEPLTNYPNGETEIENTLIEGVEQSDDLLTYTFSLVEGAQFHNGEEVTANDVIYSWRRLAESENSSRTNFILESTFLTIDHETETQENDEGEEVEVVVPDSLALEAIDDYTLEMTLAQPNANALELLAYAAFAVIPEGYVGDIEGYDGEVDQSELATESPVGSGPFQFETWNPDSEAEVSRFDDYHGSVANVDGVHWQIMEDDDSIYTYAMEGSADIFGIPTAQYDPDLVDAETDDLGRQIGTYGPLENGETAQYNGVPQLSTYYLAFNAAHTPQAVRQAISYVNDHDELITQIFKERGEAAYTFTPPGIWPGGQDEYESFIEDYPYSAGETDRESAREVLEEAGYTQDDPFELTLTTYESDVFQEAGRILRDKLSGIGIELQLEEAPFSTLLERGTNGELAFYSLGWTWSWPEADYGFFGFEPENTVTGEPMQSGETNGYYLDWPESDSDAVEKAQNAWDQVEANPEPEEGLEARNEAYVQIEEAIWEDAIMMPLYHNLEERFHYEHVDIEPFGGMGGYQVVYNDVSLNE